MNTTQNTADIEQAADPAKPAKQSRQPRRMAREAAGERDAKPGSSTPPPAPCSTNPASAQRAGTKSAAVIALLSCPDGATLEEMIAATGWLPHTTRAALTGLKKKGKVITKGQRDDVTCYFIAGPIA